MLVQKESGGREEGKWCITMQDYNNKEGNKGRVQQLEKAKRENEEIRKRYQYLFEVELGWLKITQLQNEIN